MDIAGLSRGAGVTGTTIHLRSHVGDTTWATIHLRPHGGDTTWATYCPFFVRIMKNSNLYYYCIK